MVKYNDIIPIYREEGDNIDTTVYADLLFLINFSMDFLCFYITASLLHRKMSLLRGIIAAALGGVYAVYALLADFTIILSVFIDIGVCVLMCAIVFCKKGKKLGEVILTSAVYFAVSAALGGLMSAIFSLLNRINLPFEIIKQDSDGVSVWAFAIIAAISGLITAIGGKFFKKSAMQKTAGVEIVYKGKSVRTEAICDSGNLLCEPVSGKPVIVVDIEVIKKMLPSDFVKFVIGENSACYVPNTRDKIFIIPAKTATGNGLLYAFTPDKIRIYPSEGKKEPYEVDALFAPSSIMNTADGYSALLPNELLV